MTEIPDWAADMVEANEALGDKLDRVMAGVEATYKAVNAAPKASGTGVKSHTSHRPGGASGPAATGRFTRCECECRCWSREAGKMYVGRLGSEPCCECDVDGTYGVQACSCRGRHGDQEVIAEVDVNGTPRMRWMPVTSPEGMKAIGAT